MTTTERTVAYYAQDEGTRVELTGAADLDEARELAEEWMRDAYEPQDATYWVHCMILSGDDDVEGLRVEIQPNEPACIGDAEHDWQTPYSILGGLKENPGVWGHGGGVVSNECCMRCGCRKTTDTWAQDPENGEQGLTQISYAQHEYAEHLEMLGD